MLKKLTTVGVGPAERFDLECGERLTVITGDNGLGKSFLLDVAWWVCARDWPDGRPAYPSYRARRRGLNPTISAELTGRGGGTITPSFDFNPEWADWKRKGKGRPPIPGLILYARIDGGFSVWDPARHYYWKSITYGIDTDSRASAFHLSKHEVWNGKQDDQGNIISRGLLVDWGDWQSRNAEEYAMLRQVLARLSPDGEPITPSGQFVRLPGPSAARVPTLTMPYGPLPLTLASAGLRRIIALAYFVVWVWSEHRAAAEANGMPVEQQLIIILDEVEAHLHPKWQRTILPSLLHVAEALGNAANIQIIASTHAPLVLASIEPEFDEARDALYHLRLNDSQPMLDRMDWEKRGRASAWLRSEIFGLDEERSLPASRAIAEADAMIESAAASDDAVESMEARLADHLPTMDVYWAKWSRFKLMRGSRA